MPTCAIDRNFYIGLKYGEGSRRSLYQKLQTQQDIMSKLTLGKDYTRLSARQRQHLLNWLPISQEIEYAAAKTTFKIINDNKPEELSALMPTNTKGLKILNHRKLDTKPAWLTRSKVARDSFRARAYHYNLLPSAITSEMKFSHLKKQLQNFLPRKIFQ